MRRRSRGPLKSRRRFSEEDAYLSDSDVAALLGTSPTAPGPRGAGDTAWNGEELRRLVTTVAERFRPAVRALTREIVRECLQSSKVRSQPAAAGEEESDFMRSKLRTFFTSLHETK
ncbi:uncharacterized protein LOC144107089 isoform X1 [Amblyomma americanum]